MAEWFFRKKSKVEVERDPGWDWYSVADLSIDELSPRGKGLTDLANQWKDDEE